MIEYSKDKTHAVIRLISDVRLDTQDKGSLRILLHYLLCYIKVRLNTWRVTMGTLRKQYTVSRPVYSEDSFAEDHEKIHRKHKTILDHVKGYFT